MAKWTYAVKSREEIAEHGLCAWYAILINDLDSYTGKTAADYESENFTVLSDDEFHGLLEENEKRMIGDWKEITEEEYEYALNVLPPKRWHDGGFYMGECYGGSLYSFYQKRNGKFYTSLQNIFTNRSEILENLEAWIASRPNCHSERSEESKSNRKN